MKDFETIDSEVIDLGQASVETKGDAIFEIDVDAGQLRYVPGLIEE
ncbi:benenodin family lasso peptide [Pelagerythrobacter aerophilus]|jgi:hypothetical protein|uniref:Benenodin family lasso peptide n=1 Tax=Pelagerythrobacter aerophilus TaxID=2306995 RepID=A0A418NL52_9SPHN|nr:benenodin family lasso peptide [Pelagerythrobacter aerophilus]RIV80233.1 benenodin family lasso peptide [Pelagerythrobacter aerophilus]